MCSCHVPYVVTWSLTRHASVFRRPTALDSSSSPLKRFVQRTVCLAHDYVLLAFCSTLARLIVPGEALAMNAISENGCFGYSCRSKRFSTSLTLRGVPPRICETRCERNVGTTKGRRRSPQSAAPTIGAFSECAAALSYDCA